MNIEHLVTGPLCVNTWIIGAGNGGAAVIDPAGDVSAIIARMREMDRNPLAIILTHGHFDHVLGVAELKKALPDVPLCIHGADAAYLGKNARRLHLEDAANLGVGDIIAELYRELPEPDRLLADGDMLFPGTEAEWRVVHTPGHTLGSLCLYNEKEKLLIAGDTLFRGGIGRTDLRGGSFRDLEQSLLTLSCLPADVRVFPGHGGTTTIGFELL